MSDLGASEGVRMMTLRKEVQSRVGARRAVDLEKEQLCVPTTDSVAL